MPITTTTIRENKLKSALVGLGFTILAVVGLNSVENVVVSDNCFVNLQGLYVNEKGDVSVEATTTPGYVLQDDGCLTDHEYNEIKNVILSEATTVVNSFALQKKRFWREVAGREFRDMGCKQLVFRNANSENIDYKASNLVYNKKCGECEIVGGIVDLSTCIEY